MLTVNRQQSVGAGSLSIFTQKTNMSVKPTRTTVNDFNGIIYFLEFPNLTG
ncbi:hypothetical protein NIES2100_74260 [Calothrix sp. NIES-2100]|nr:hypothetical protein NIES2100_74260 [Calothrix sp. NIES-2100]